MKSKKRLQLLFIGLTTILSFPSCGKQKTREAIEIEPIEYENKAPNNWESEIPNDLDKLSSKYKTLIGVLEPSLVEFEYQFPKEWIDKSQKIDWEERGFDTEFQGIMSRLAHFTFDGVKVGEYKEHNIISPFYRDSLKPKSQDKGFDKSVRLNIFRHPDTGLPLLAINGKVVNVNHFRISQNNHNPHLIISARIDRSNPLLNFNDSSFTLPSYDPYKMITVSTDALKWEGGNQDSYNRITDSNITSAEADPEKYMFVNISMNNAYDESPSIDLDVDGEQFALIKNTWMEEKITPEVVMKVKNNLFDKTFTQTIYEYNSGVGVAVAPGEINQYIEKHNK